MSLFTLSLHMFAFGTILFLAGFLAGKAWAQDRFAAFLTAHCGADLHRKP